MSENLPIEPGIPDEGREAQLQREIAELNRERQEISSQALRMIGDSCLPWALLLLSITILANMPEQAALYLRILAVLPGVAGAGLLIFFYRKNGEKSRKNQARMKEIMKELDERQNELDNLSSQTE